MIIIINREVIMTTFVLSKYNPEPENQTHTQDAEVEQKEESKVEKVLLKLDGTVSELVARSLYEILGRNLHVDQVETGEVDEMPTKKVVKTITTEEINKDPVKAYSQISKGDTIYISNEGFTTDKEEWFLSTMKNMGVKVLLTPKALAKYAQESLEESLTPNLDTVTTELIGEVVEGSDTNSSGDTETLTESDVEPSEGSSGMDGLTADDIVSIFVDNFKKSTGQHDN